MYRVHSSKRVWRHNQAMDRLAATEWIGAHVTPIGPIQTTHEQPWATVLRVQVPDGVVWFKACAPVQAFEPRLTAELFARWPDRVPRVIARDDERAWLLLADAGTPVRLLGNPPELWQRALPLYAELQRGEASFAGDHVAHGVPHLPLACWPARYENLFRQDLPLENQELRQLVDFAPRFSELCDELATYGLPETVQHDDLHMANLYIDGARLRVLDWGDSSISHPFASLVETFRFLEEVNGLLADDPWFSRLRDAYLEPWGAGLSEVAALAIQTGAFAHAFAWVRQRDMLQGKARANFDEVFRIVLRRALRQALKSTH